jgi:DivIVA domain-containing protein
LVPMEVTPKVFRDVQFREKARGGYHPEDVDEFLEQAAIGTEALLERLREATERADRAEKEATDASANDDALKRMLLMGQRTVDQAVKEARDEADQLLVAARAKSVALVADAEERGRQAYEDSLAENRSKVDEATARLRQVEQEVEVLRGWVDVNRSHLLAVMRDAQGLIENTGLLSQPPQLSEPEEADEGGVQPETATAEDDDASAAEIAGADDGALDDDNAPTGEWDSRLLDNVGRDDLEPATALPPETVEDGEAAGGTGSNGSLAVAGTPTEDAGDGPHSSPGDQTRAFDERALDSFFNEQDLGDERGLGRFRRRQ